MMPYLKEQDREHMDDGHQPMTPCELNYVITRQLIQYVEMHGLSYKILNDVVGAMECAKLEFYQRVVVPYESQKGMENGDVYSPLLTVMYLGSNPSPKS